jgi:enoyl-CoA hydratase/carnithine racemase
MALITLNRPEKLNALSSELLKQLDSLLDVATRDSRVHVIVITGTGRAFAAGADIHEYMRFTQEEFQHFTELGGGVNRKIEQLAQPVIAAVNGYAVGGGFELALSADMIVASEKAQFGFPEIRLGLFPGGGATQKLPRLLGIQQARRLILTGEMISAAEAATFGLVYKVVQPDSLLTAATQAAYSLATKPLTALAEAKAVLNASLEFPFSTGLALERDRLLNLFISSDAQEGIAAFAQHRQPRFQSAWQKPVETDN